MSRLPQPPEWEETRRFVPTTPWNRRAADIAAARAAEDLDEVAPTRGPAASAEATFLRLLAKARNGRDAFTLAVGCPYLVFPEGFNQTQSKVQTLMDLEHEVSGVPGAVPVKKAATPFSFMITIGRAPNNDVVIPDPRVSKFHAYVRSSGDGWKITEAATLNGTQVDEQALERGSAALTSGALVSFGGARAVFLLPDALYGWVVERFGGAVGAAR